MNPVVTALRENLLFDQVDETVLSRMAEKMTPRDFAAGDYVIREGEAGGALFLLAHGALNVFVGEKLVTSYEAGEIFGEIGALTGGRRMASVVATSPSQVLAISKTDFQEILHNSPGLGPAVIQSLARYLG